MKCFRCHATDKLVSTMMNGQIYTQCKKCYSKARQEKKDADRSKIDITENISLKLERGYWALFEQKADGNKPAYLHNIVMESLNNRSKWNDDACLGYAIKGLERLEYPPNEIKKIILSIFTTFDTLAITEAEKKYVNSPY